MSIYEIIKESIKEQDEELLLEFFKDSDLKQKVVTSQVTANHYKGLFKDLKKAEKELKSINSFYGLEYKYDSYLQKDIIKISMNNPSTLDIDTVLLYMDTGEFQADGQEQNGKVTILIFSV